jgi:hypothetical protein
MPPAGPRIPALLELIFPLMDHLCRKTCPDCTNICCRRAWVWADFRDLLFCHLAGIPRPDQQLLDRSGRPLPLCRPGRLPIGSDPAALCLYLVPVPGTDAPPSTTPAEMNPSRRSSSRSNASGKNGNVIYPGSMAEPGVSFPSPIRRCKVGGLQSQGAKGEAVGFLLRSLGNTGSGVLRLLQLWGDLFFEHTAGNFIGRLPPTAGGRLRGWMMRFMTHPSGMSRGNRSASLTLAVSTSRSSRISRLCRG